MNINPVILAIMLFLSFCLGVYSGKMEERGRISQASTETVHEARNTLK